MPQQSSTSPLSMRIPGQILGRFPREYRRRWLAGDLASGVTVAAYLIPQCLAYAELAGVEPIRGLWGILPTLVIYALLGSSPQLSVGPESTTAVMTAAAVGPLVGADPSTYAGLCGLLALLVGGICCLGAWARLGFLANLLSRPILIGYMAGVAVIMIVGQVGRVSGLPMEESFLPQVLMELWQRRQGIHLPTLLVALGVLVLLLGVHRRFPRAPVPLLAVLAATAVVAAFRLDQRGVAVIGTIPAGLPPFAVPLQASVQQWRGLVSAAVGIALVGYSDNMLTARSFAARNGYRIEPDRELLALGACNLGTGLFGGFPVSSSGSRTAIGDSLGSRSQLYSLVALGVVVTVLLVLRPVLARFPLAALGAIVIYAALRLIDVEGLRNLRRFRRSEFHLALITMAGVLLTDILVGVALAVGLSVIDLFARLMRPHAAVIGEVPHLAGLHDVGDWQGSRTLPGLVLYRYDAPLCFANAEHFRHNALAAVEAEQQPVRWFVLNAEAIIEIDSTAVESLADLCRGLQQRGIVVGMARVKQELFALLERGGIVDLIGPDRFYPTLPTAVSAFRAASQQDPGGAVHQG